MYVSSWHDQGQFVGGVPIVYEQGNSFGGGNNAPFVPSADDPSNPIPGAPGIPNLRRGPINNWTDAPGHGAVLAMNPATGEPAWKFRMTDVTDTGVVTTATDLLFTGGREGYLQALDAHTGKLLWKANLGAQMLNNPITYAVNGRQYVAAIAGLSLFAFALPADGEGF
jgi:outer membrane protein assembly factor BamB